MSTSTSTLTEYSPSPHQFASVPSLGTAQSTQSSGIARTYKQASQLFVTRRIKEALETLDSLIQRTDSPHDDVNGEAFEQAEAQSQQQHPAPIASASRGARVKVWSLYISIVNEIVEMGSDAGKHTFGASRWKQYATKARDGSIWAEVVDVGYAGIEGDVDAEVVANLCVELVDFFPYRLLTRFKGHSVVGSCTIATINPTAS